MSLLDHVVVAVVTAAAAAAVVPSCLDLCKFLVEYNRHYHNNHYYQHLHHRREALPTAGVAFPFVSSKLWP